MGERLKTEFKSRITSFKYAFAGLWYVLRTQKNAWIHALVSVAVILVGFWLRISLQEWALLILTMLIVWMAEFFNSAIEAVVDMSMPDPHPLAKIAKDVSAAAVLIGACGSVIVGLLVLGPPLYQRLFL